MKIQDDREGTQQSRLSVLVGGKDAGMSGWGGAEGGTSYAFWACAPEHADQVETWVDSRSDIGYVKTRGTAPSGMPKDHCHIYCVEVTHPALQGGGYNKGEAKRPVGGMSILAHTYHETQRK